MEDVLKFIEYVESTSKTKFYYSSFVPNFANKIFSSETRGIYSELMIDRIKRDSRKGMEIFEFVNLVGTMERQAKKTAVRIGRSYKDRSLTQ